jgi:hypothetical protein
MCNTIHAYIHRYIHMYMRAYIHTCMEHFLLIFTITLPHYHVPKVVYSLDLFKLFLEKLTLYICICHAFYWLEWTFFQTTKRHSIFSLKWFDCDYSMYLSKVFHKEPSMFEFLYILGLHYAPCNQWRHGMWNEGWCIDVKSKDWHVIYS